MNLAYKKILGKFTKVLGFGKTPPPHVGKNSQIVSFFLFENVPKVLKCKINTKNFFWIRGSQKGGVGGGPTFGKNSQIISFFSPENVPKSDPTFHSF